MLSVQLEYSEAYSKLMQSLRKAPQNDKTAYGFKLLVSGRETSGRPPKCP